MLPWRVFDEAADPVPSPHLTVAPQLAVDVRHRIQSLYTGRRHEYTLVIEVENRGPSKVTDFRIDVWFPKAFLDVESYQSFEVLQQESETHKLIRRTHLNFPPYNQTPLYQGDAVHDELIRYAVTTETFNGRLMGRDLIDLPVTVIVYADGMAPQRIERPFRTLQNF